jgi:asparagine synthase (glutamine-hydrolysing)
LPGFKEVRVFPPGHVFSSKTGRFSSYYAPATIHNPMTCCAVAAVTKQLTAADLLPKDPSESKWRASIEPASFGGGVNGPAPNAQKDSAAAARSVRAELERAVKKRLDHGDVSDVVGVLCSGGVDSAAITCLAREILISGGGGGGSNKRMRVFTMKYREGRSDDAFYAGLLCAHLGVDHRTFEFGPDDLEDIEATATAVIRACETCDPNTIRAAIPMYLLAKAIRTEAPEVKVVLSGEGADELFGGYNYFRLAPDASSASAECDRLLRNLHMFDLLRADRCFAAHGLEVRVPFLDPALIDVVRAGVSAERRVSGEKQLLRDAVADVDALSRFRILDRAKEKFSDGAGFTYVPDLLRRIAADADGGDDGTLETRLAAEKAFYRKIFDREFGAVGDSRDAWVVERELPSWKEVEARRRGDAGGGARFGMTG